MTERRDIFFGKYKFEEGALLWLSDINKLADKYDAPFFTRQLNRFLAENGRRVVIRDSDTGPHFWGLLDSIEKSSIGAVEISARTDIADNIDATLACDLIMDDGVVSVVPYWCAYKPLRARELISTLLLPICLKGLHTRTYIRWDNERSEQLFNAISSDLTPAVEKAFSLAKHPSAIRPYEDSEKRLLQNEIYDLAYAQDVSKEELTGNAVWERLREIRQE